VNTLLAALVNGMIVSTVPVAFVWLLLRLDSGRAINASTRYVVWCASLITVIAAPLYYVNLPVSESRATTVDSTSDVSPIRIEGANVLAGPPVPEQSSERSLFPVFITATTWPRWVLLAWVTTALVMVIRLAVAFGRIERFKSRTSKVSAEYPFRLSEWLSHRGVRRRNIRFAVSSEIRTPMASGPYAPTILIPANLLEEMTQDEIDQVWMHEASHLARFDDFVLICQRLIEAVFVFHPLVHWIVRNIELEREIACDDYVIEGTRRPGPYALCLTRIAEQAGRIARAPRNIPATEFRSQLERRVEMLLDNKRNSGTRLLRLTLAGLVGVLAGLCWIVSGIPQAVLFAESLSEIATIAKPPIENEQVPARTPEPIVQTTRQSAVPMVFIPVIVTEPAGRYVTNLDASSFQIFEDKVEQEIVHFSTGRRLLTSLVFSGANSFGSEAFQAVQRRLIARPSDRANVAVGMTQASATGLYGYLGSTLELLNAPDSIVIASDGTAPRDDFMEARTRDLVSRAGIPVYVISMLEKEPFLEELAQISGGRFLRMDDGVDPSGLLSSLDKITLGLANRYVLGYRPKNGERDGSFRSLQLNARLPQGGPQLSVRYQNGYYAPNQ